MYMGQLSAGPSASSWPNQPIFGWILNWRAPSFKLNPGAHVSLRHEDNTRCGRRFDRCRARQSKTRRPTTSSRVYFRAHIRYFCSQLCIRRFYFLRLGPTEFGLPWLGWSDGSSAWRRAVDPQPTHEASVGNATLWGNLLLDIANVQWPNRVASKKLRRKLTRRPCWTS